MISWAIALVTGLLARNEAGARAVANANDNQSPSRCGAVLTPGGAITGNMAVWSVPTLSNANGVVDGEQHSLGTWIGIGGGPASDLLMARVGVVSWLDNESGDQSNVIFYTSGDASAPMQFSYPGSDLPEIKAGDQIGAFVQVTSPTTGEFMLEDLTRNFTWTQSWQGLNMTGTSALWILEATGSDKTRAYVNEFDDVEFTQLVAFAGDAELLDLNSGGLVLDQLVPAEGDHSCQATKMAKDAVTLAWEAMGVRPGRV